MSTTLSMISRQCAEGTSRTFQLQSVYFCGSMMSSSSGGRTSWSAALPSWSCQTISRPLRSTVSYFWVRARSGIRRAYGIALHLPSPPQRQSWKGQAISSPFTVPWVRSPPMWRQYPSSTLSSPLPPCQTTSLPPKASTACGLPSSNCVTGPRQCHPRANRSGAVPRSRDRAPVERASERVSGLAALLGAVLLVMGSSSVLSGGQVAL